MKKFSFNFLTIACAGVLALVGWVLLLVTNGVAGFAVDNGGLAIGLGLVAAALCCAGAFAAEKFGAQNVITAAVKVCALALIMVVIGVLIADRANLASGLFTWDSHNSVGWTAFSTAVASIVFFLLAVVAHIVSAFQTGKKA